RGSVQGTMSLQVVLLVALAASHPDPKQLARHHFERAEKLYAVEKFEAALGEYEAAYQAEPLPGFLFNIGQCYRNLGNWRQATFAFKKYLQQKPDARNRAAVENLIADLEHKIAADEKHDKGRPELLAPRAPDTITRTMAFAAPPEAPEAPAARPF